MRSKNYFFWAAFLFAAQRAFISSDNLFLPAGVSPPFFDLIEGAVPSPLRLAHLALAAAANLARVEADTLLPLSPPLKLETEPSRSELKRFSRASICRRIPTASSNFFRVII
jgi:hypothetical protein